MGIFSHLLKEPMDSSLLMTAPSASPKKTPVSKTEQLNKRNESDQIRHVAEEEFQNKH